MIFPNLDLIRTIFFGTNLFFDLKNHTNFFIIFSEIVDYLLKIFFKKTTQIYFSSVFVIRILNISTKNRGDIR